MSGSVLVEYEPGIIDPNTLIACAAQAAGLEIARPEDERPQSRVRPGRVAIETARKVNGLIDELTGGRADLSDLVPATLSGLAVYSFIVGKDRLPRWDSLAYWAYSIFQNLHATEIRGLGRRRG
jgi:hypothetical protein